MVLITKVLLYVILLCEIHVATAATLPADKALCRVQNCYIVFYLIILFLI